MGFIPVVVMAACCWCPVQLRQCLAGLCRSHRVCLAAVRNILKQRNPVLPRLAGGSPLPKQAASVHYAAPLDPSALARRAASTVQLMQLCMKPSHCMYGQLSNMCLPACLACCVDRSGSWGESGYFKLKVGVGKGGLCGIASTASYPIKEHDNPRVPLMCDPFGWSECSAGSTCSCNWPFFFNLFCIRWV